MLQALLAGVASIKAQQTRMNVIGNNLANVNTTAYKGSRVTFQDMLAQTIRGSSRPSATLGGTNPIQFGLGVLIGGTDTNNEQGSLNATNRPTDLSIQGNGYFMVGNGVRVAYTRDGAFELDANGDLVHRATGERLVGWTADSFGIIDTTSPISPASALRVPIGQLTAVQVTNRVDFGGTLDARAAATDSWTTQVRVYDTLGGAHDIQVRFYNRTPNPASPPAPAGAISQWDWEATEPPLPGLIGTSAGATPTGEALFFDQNGVIMNPAALNNVNVPAGSAPAFMFALNFGAIGQLSTESQVQPTQQNGYPAGSLQAFSIGADGIVTGIFTNGLTRPLGQIAMSIFPNPNGLERMGTNLWRETNNSGIPVIGQPRNGGRGSINAGFLEQSNVDIGQEFTDLIVTQRGFQANTRVVTTVDEMLQDLLNMKR